ncbi:MAG: PepSY domain-containing protein [Nitrospirales bacterium]|nr:PepSY domain-containing protein [Nitrospirales bacterium]
MAKGDAERKMRNAHRWIAMAALGFFLLSLITGLLWANARFLYWEDHYKEKVHTVSAPPLESARIALPAAIDVAKAVVAGQAHVDQVTLRSDAGRVFYDIRFRANGKARTVLVDAVNGERLSPISEELARGIARQYVNEAADVTAVSTEQYTSRKKHHAQDAIRVGFNDPNRTEIILDRQTGEILEDEGRWRKLHFFVMQVHQLNFFGFEKTLLNVPGIPLLLMSLTGVVLWRIQAARKDRTGRVHGKRADHITSHKPVMPDRDANAL